MENKDVTEKFNRADVFEEINDKEQTATICYEVVHELQEKLNEFQELANKLATTYKKECIIQDLGIMCAISVDPRIAPSPISMCVIGPKSAAERNLEYLQEALNE